MSRLVRFHNTWWQFPLILLLLLLFGAWYERLQDHNVQEATREEVRQWLIDVEKTEVSAHRKAIDDEDMVRSGRVRFKRYFLDTPRTDGSRLSAVDFKLPVVRVGPDFTYVWDLSEIPVSAKIIDAYIQVWSESSPGPAWRQGDGSYHELDQYTLKYPVREVEQVMDGDRILQYRLEDEASEGSELLGIVNPQFGTRRDWPSKRPFFDLMVALDTAGISTNNDFVLELGQEEVFPVQKHPGKKLLLSAEVLSRDNPGRDPDIYVRGGRGEPDESVSWVLLTNPLRRDWDWSQFKITLRPVETAWKQPVVISLTVPHVQLPEGRAPRVMMFSPSGTLKAPLMEDVSTEKSGDTRSYRFEFVPREPGLWRYLWFFMPDTETPLHSYESTGMFYVDMPTEFSDIDEWVNAYAHRFSKPTSISDEYRVNRLVRWLAQYSLRGEKEKQYVDQALALIRSKIPQPEKPQVETDVAN